MENWKNVNKILILNQKENNKRDFETLTLVELCMSGATPPDANTIEPDEEFIKLISLLKEGATLNWMADLNTPLIAAMRTDNIKLAKSLYKYGAKINYKHPDMKDDAFWEALKTKKYDFLEFFVSNRCILERNLINRHKKLSENEEENEEEMVKNLPNLETPLIYATIESDEKAVEILLRHYKINVNERGENGNTALHFNILKDPQSEADSAIGIMLVAAGAETNSKNLDGHTVDALANDPHVKSMLLAAKMEKIVPHKDTEIVLENGEEKIIQVKPTKKKKI